MSAIGKSNLQGAIPYSKRSFQNKGFTLVELILVLVILSILAALGSKFLFTALNSYDQSQTRFKLIAKGRVSIEQITRQLRMAVPNSVRVSASNNCIEFLPIVAGANYEGELPDSNNLAPEISSIATSSFTLGLGTPAHVVVAPASSSEIYTNSSTASRVSLGGLGSSPYTAIPLASNHRFIQNSNNKRVYLASNPKRFCLSGGALIQYKNYGLITTGLSDTNPGGSTILMAQNVSTDGNVFTLSNGSVNRNISVNIALRFTQGTETIDLYQTVFIRNVP